MKGLLICKSIVYYKRKTDETDSTDSFTGIDVHLSGTFYALILAVVTFVENSYGPAIAREYFYYAPWFILLQLLQAVNLSAMFLQGSYFKRISKGSLIFHGAFLFIWLGAAVTHYVGVTGIMHIREGETANSMMKR